VGGQGGCREAFVRLGEVDAPTIALCDRDGGEDAETKKEAAHEHQGDALVRTPKAACRRASFAKPIEQALDDLGDELAHRDPQTRRWQDSDRFADLRPPATPRVFRRSRLSVREKIRAGVLPAVRLNDGRALLRLRAEPQPNVLLRVAETKRRMRVRREDVGASAGGLTWGGASRSRELRPTRHALPCSPPRSLSLRLARRPLRREAGDEEDERDDDGQEDAEPQHQPAQRDQRRRLRLALAEFLREAMRLLARMRGEPFRLLGELRSARASSVGGKLEPRSRTAASDAGSRASGERRGDGP